MVVLTPDLRSAVLTKILRHLKLLTALPPLAAPQEMWESESYELIPQIDKHCIDERYLAGIDDDTLTLPPGTSCSHPDAVCLYFENHPIHQFRYQLIVRGSVGRKPYFWSFPAFVDSLVMRKRQVNHISLNRNLTL